MPDALPMPRSLSPSSMSTFTSCPLAFRFSYIDRLPEAPSAPASKGTLVHLALQHLMWRPPADRTIENGLLDLARAVDEVATDPEFAHLELTEEEWAGFHRDAEVLLRRYFEIEDPTQITVLGLELRVTAETADGVVIRGIIDRLELDADGELVVTDYKTGREPGQGWEQQSLAGVHIYSLLCEKMLGRRPKRVQLLYLNKPERIITYPSDQSVRGVELKSGAVMKAVRSACARADFRPRASALCAYCSFREFCPAFGGDPAQAAPVMLARQAEREGRPQLPLVIVEPAPADRMRAPIIRFDLAVDRAVDRVRSPTLDRIVYRLSSAADHSLLWDVCGTVTAIARGDDVAFAARFVGAMGVESLLTNGVVKSAFRRVRPAAYENIVFSYGLHRPITTSFPSGHATAAFCAARLLGGGPGWYTLATAVAATRVYVRLHHASDVAAGAAFGLVLGSALRRFVQ